MACVPPAIGHNDLEEIREEEGRREGVARGGGRVSSLTLLNRRDISQGHLLVFIVNPSLQQSRRAEALASTSSLRARESKSPCRKCLRRSGSRTILYHSSCLERITT